VGESAATVGPESVSGADGSFDGDEERRCTVDIDVDASETLLKRLPRAACTQSKEYGQGIKENKEVPQTKKTVCSWP